VAIPASPATRSEAEWLERGRALVLQSDLDGALAMFDAAHAEHPASADIALALAGVLWQSKQPDRAEAVLRASLAARPAHVAATFLLAKILKEQARMNAAAMAVRTLFDAAPQPVGTTIQAVELLDDAGRKQDAADLCETAIAHGSTDPRIYAYAGMLHLQLGDFARVRERYTYAIANSAQAYDWQVANGLASAQRYADASHADFALFRDALARSDLGERARASLQFALGKAHDDIGDYERAAAYFRDGNATVAGFTAWPRKNFRRMVAARLDAKPIAQRLEAAADCVPIFIVGMPRSGTTLAAELLSRHPDVRYRGELGLMPFLAQQVGSVARPTAAMLEKTAATYVAQLREDDAPAQFYIDKQPLNFLHIDLIAALFPNARIIHCERSERDTALSIWMQYFAGPENNFAYDFDDIAAVMQGSAKLIASAQKKHAAQMRTIRYEDLVADSTLRMRELAAWIGLGDFDASAAPSEATISTSSLWQVRQPVYARSIGRWRAYAPYVPELTQFSDGA
jgi:sulfotransferase family protein/tetratricopeptide repeat protein